LAVVLLGLAGARPGQAHNLPYSLVTLSVSIDGDWRLTLECHTAALVMGLPQQHLTPAARAGLAQMPDAELAQRASLMQDYLRRATVIEINGRRIETPSPQFPTVPEIREDGVQTLQTALPSAPLVLQGRLPAGAANMTLTFPPELGTVLLKTQQAGAAAAQALTPGEQSAPVRIRGPPPSPLRTIGQYLRLGYLHILPGGFDHILFVLSLFLLNPRWKPLAAQVTAFTVAHSVTLSLAVFGIVSLPARLVETMIAVSIAVVAVDNLRTAKLAPWRPFVVFGFGLLHGLGFASVLKELGLPRGQEALALATFNVGIELGQLTVLASAFLVLGWTIRKAWYRARVVIPCSLAITAVATIWAIQRSHF
jgi:hypothetical protein